MNLYPSQGHYRKVKHQKKKKKIVPDVKSGHLFHLL